MIINMIFRVFLLAFPKCRYDAAVELGEMLELQTEDCSIPEGARRLIVEQPNRSSYSALGVPR